MHPRITGRRTRRHLFVVLALASTLVAGVDTAGRAPAAHAAVVENQMFYLDATNPASFDGGASWRDLSGNGRHGTISGTGISYDEATRSMQFPGGPNGTAWVELGGSFDDFSAGISIEFEGEFGATRSAWERIFDFALGVDSTANAFWVGQRATSNELALEAWISGVNQGRCSTATGGTALGPIGERTFAKWMITLGDVGGTNKCRIYKDGVELQTNVQNASGSAFTPTVPDGSPYPLPAITTRSSKFLGRSNWSADGDFEGSIRYIRLYNATLTPDDVADNASSTVTFDANGGTGSMAPQVSTGEASLTPNAFTRRGYTFTGWDTAVDGTGSDIADAATYTFTADTTLYAQWVRVPANFLPLTPARLDDTRSGSPLAGGGLAREVQVAGLLGVPADASAVVLNVTATRSTGDGYLTVFPCGADRPETSNVNFLAGEDTANQVTAKLDEAGRVCVYASATTDVVLDLNGAYSRSAGTQGLRPLAPARLFDSRGDGPVGPASPTEVVVAGTAGVPANAAAVVLNVTVTNPTSAGYATAYPCGAAAPPVSNLNFPAGATVPNLVTVAVGAGGKVCVTTTAVTDLVIDVAAAFAPDAEARFDALDPARLADTRRSATLQAGVPYEVTVADRHGVGANAVAASFNVTVVDPATAGYLTVYPCGAEVPYVSNLNFVEGRTIANAVTIGLASGRVCVVSTTAAHLLVDVSGGFLPGLD